MAGLFSPLLCATPDFWCEPSAKGHVEARRSLGSTRVFWSLTGGGELRSGVRRTVGLWEEMDRRMKGPPSGRGYEPHAFVQGAVWMLHAGGRRLEDLRELRAEQEVLRAMGLEVAPEAETVGGWLRRQGRAAPNPLSLLHVTDSRRLVRRQRRPARSVRQHLR